MKQKFLAVAVILSIGFVACKKDDTTAPSAGTTSSGTTSSGTTTSSTSGSTTGVSADADVASAEEDALAEDLFESTQGLLDEGLEESDNSSLRKLLKRPGNCADVKVTIDSVAGTATSVYTFAGETCDDGRTRSGEITIVANRKSFRDNGAVLTVTFADFKVDGYSFSAKRVITNKSSVDGVSGRHQTMVVTGADGTGSATITKASGTTFKWYAERTRKQTAGADTRTKFDDKFHVYGKQGGESSNGHKFSSEVSSTTPLLVDNSCKKYRVVAGVRTVKRDSNTFTIHYGDGTCDNKIVVMKSDSSEKEVTVGIVGTIPESTGKVSTDTASSITGAQIKAAIVLAKASVAVNASGDVTTITDNADGSITKKVVVKKGTFTDETWTTTIYANGTTYTKVEEPGKTDANLIIKGLLTKDGNIIGRAEVENSIFHVVVKPDNSLVGQAKKNDGSVFIVVRKADGSMTATEKNASGVVTKIHTKNTDGVKKETAFEADGSTVKTITIEQPDGTKITKDGSGNIVTQGGTSTDGGTSTNTDGITKPNDGTSTNTGGGTSTDGGTSTNTDGSTKPTDGTSTNTEGTTTTDAGTSTTTDGSTKPTDGTSTNTSGGTETEAGTTTTTNGTAATN